jgi:carboxylesterase
MHNCILSNQPFFLKSSTKDKNVCLLLHGLGGGVYELQLLGQYLYDEKGWSVKGINYPGHDKPSEKMPYSTWQEWYQYVQLVYQKLINKYLSVSIVGFSTGCLLGLHLAASYPVKTLVLLSPYISLKYKWYYLLPSEIYLLTLGDFIKDVSQAQKPIQDKCMRERAEKVASFQTLNVKAIRSTNQLINIVKSEIPKIKIPTLIIQSLKDSVVSPCGASFIYENIGSEIKKLHWLQQSDHIIALDLEKDEVFLLVEKFLSQFGH